MPEVEIGHFSEVVSSRATRLQTELAPVLATKSDEVAAASIAPTFVAKGFVVFATAWVYSVVTGIFQLPNGKEADFNGQAWGPGLTGQGTVGPALFRIPESELEGEMNFVVTSGAFVGAGAVIVWWKGSTAVGEYGSLGLGIGANAAYGSGSWNQR